MATVRVRVCTDDFFLFFSFTPLLAKLLKFYRVKSVGEVQEVLRENTAVKH